MDVSTLHQYFNTAPSSWSLKEVSLWLELLNMKEYQNSFESNKVDGLIIFDLDNNEIEEILGVHNSIHRKRLRNGINMLKQFQDDFESKMNKYTQDERMFQNGFAYTNNFPNVFSNPGSVIKSQVSQIMYTQKYGDNQFGIQPAPKRELDKLFLPPNFENFEEANNYINENYIAEQFSEERSNESVFLKKVSQQEHKRNKPKSKTKKRVKRTSTIAHDKENLSPINSNPQNLVNMSIEEDMKPQNDTSDFPIISSQSTNTVDDHFISPQNYQQTQMIVQEAPNQNFLSQNIPQFSQEQCAPELILQPIDETQSNNFYCINDKGGKIGRHSNNEIVLFEESVSRYHALIEYKEGRFFIKDTESTTGSFIKIVDPLPLREKMIVELGSNQFYVKEIRVHDDDNGEMHLVVIEGIHADQEFVIKNHATLGRKWNVNSHYISLEEDLHLSNVHAKISFFGSEFVLEDLGSTNGSWLRLSPENEESPCYELLDGMVFKIGANCIFKVKKSNSKYLEMLQPSNENNTGDRGMTCAICYENDRDVVFIPCKHNVTCIKCSKNVKQCPVCRVKINDIMKIYRS